MNAREMQEIITKVCTIEYENYRDYLEKYSDKPENTMLKILGNYFEGIGILVAKKVGRWGYRARFLGRHHSVVMGAN
jgi:hypothetical protein